MKKFLQNNYAVIAMFATIAITLAVLWSGSASAELVDTGETSATLNAEISTEVHNTPLVITDVVVDNITKDSAKISWKTNLNATCTLFYGETIYYSDSRQESEFIIAHYFYLFDLTPDMLYHFKIYCESEQGEKANTEDDTFRTLKPEEVPPTTIVEYITKYYEEIKEEVKYIEEKYEELVPVKEILPKENCYSIILSSDAYKFLQLLFALLGLLLALTAVYYPEFANLPLLIMWDRFITYFPYLFDFSKKRRGKVYDAESEYGIPNAKITLLDAEGKNVITEVHTGYKGEYELSAKAGKYIIMVEKKYFTYPSVITESDYHKEKIELNHEQPIVVDIPLDPVMSVLLPRVRRANKYSYWFAVLRIFVLVVGSIINIVGFIFFPTLLNLVLIFFFIILWFIEAIFQNRFIASGVVFESDCTPVDNSVVRIFDAKQKIAMTKANEESGYYRAMLFKGTYNFRAVNHKLYHADEKDVVVGAEEKTVKNIYLNK